MGEGEEGGGEVDGGEDGVGIDGVLFIWVDETGAPCDEGRADAAFVELGFEAAQVGGLAGVLFGAVIGAEEDEGVIAECGGVADQVEEFAELAVHIFEDGEVTGAFGAIAPGVDGWPEGAMDVIGPNVDVEGLVFGGGLVDEADGGVDEARGDFGAEHPSDGLAEALGVGPDASGFGLSGFQRERQEFGTHALEVGEGFIEAIGGDGGCVIDVALSAHVPFAEVAGGVACLVEESWQSGGVGVEPVGDPAVVVVFAVSEVGSDIPAGRVLSGGEGDPGW